MASLNYSPPEKSLDRVLHKVEQVPSLLLMGLGLLLVYVTGYVDYLVGEDMSPQIIYLILVGLVSWCAGRNAGYLIAINSGLARLIADWINMRGDMLGLVPHWNAGSFFIIALTFASLLASLRSRLDREQELARTDGLTGVCNARSFMERAEGELERARRHGYSLTIAYLDCDHFKQVNDRLGHAVGDELLKTVALIMKEGARLSDIVARLGGDEFVLLLPEVDSRKAFAVMERLREQLLEEMEKRALPVTFSIGVVTYETAPDSVLEMLRHADETMYQSKHGGKNRITHAIVPTIGQDAIGQDAIGQDAIGQDAFAEKPLMDKPPLLRPTSEASEVSS